MPRMRVVVDNDFSGDPDGLVQLVHHLLSPSVEIRAVIGSAVPAGDPFDPTGRAADNARDRAVEVLDLLGPHNSVPAVPGSNAALTSRTSPQRSAGAEALFAEAMRTDTRLPLYAVFGASLTQLASAYLIEPAIADRLTAVWIGGPEYPDTAAPPPGSSEPEYNLRIDVAAAQVVFNDSPIALSSATQRVPAGDRQLGRARDQGAPGRPARCLPLPGPRRRPSTRRAARGRHRRDLHRR
jgi:purine nucleosidase